MIKMIAISIGMIAMVIVAVAGYLSNVSFNSLIGRAIFSFFIFYLIGTVFGLIVLRNILAVLERRKIADLDNERKSLEEKIKQKQSEIESRP
ncbi:MAG: hypothetical protein DKM50_10140 [Candidatus Margulisiibacteriota bacterium]|nr:MAG: hypothetical protein A2X43_04225 [Candidatus Margulisbacteria bacterium GWD2_39_127]OGI05206.1 MAG: hypothetical protein A2X42_02735 [Candidatus Margulisbacteria bacterium GWF2_38_17]OGI06255.1 MAG: hypothetical protein A2X41_08315 [Candidatus Margulisbacteria bacterium GWE2_39_32]PZM78911.1 MAG: hypothetical protein DKM50_10140 [Candidatus Margulisiibacteriota bacterium]HAR64505.1 hypothetical protein [Candidatus Margulisiibacteriota bacterium]